jgi:fructan beta-fructosidase
MKQERQRVQFVLGGDTLTYGEIRIADDEIDYWVFADLSKWTGEKLKLTFSDQVKGIDQIYQSNKIEGEDSLYRETNRI